MVGSHLKTNATAPYLIVLLLCFYYIKLLLRKYEKLNRQKECLTICESQLYRAILVKYVLELLPKIDSLCPL